TCGTSQQGHGGAAGASRGNGIIDVTRSLDPFLSRGMAASPLRRSGGHRLALAGPSQGGSHHADRCRLSPGFSRVSRRAEAQMATRSEEHTSELQSLAYLVCRLLLEKKKSDNSQRFHASLHIVIL